jgi:hypothetical protein
LRLVTLRRVRPGRPPPVRRLCGAHTFRAHR